MKWYVKSLLVVVFTLCLPGAPDLLRAEVPIKNVTRVQGVRDNQLRGFGIVVGLAGTGDGRIAFVNRSISNALARLGIRIDDPEDASLDNVAAVMVTATLPPFKQPGDKIDVTVSSIGNAEDLSGGVLVQTPLKAGNGRTYAVAQGPVTKGGNNDERHLTTVRIPNGALVEQKVPFEFLGKKNHLELQLMSGDFTTATRVARAINERFQQPYARARNSSTVSVKLPTNYLETPVQFVSEIENLTIEPAQQSRIVINERTGTVLMGAGVTVRPVSISHDDITLVIGEKPKGEDRDDRVQFSESVTIQNLVDSLKSVGASTNAIIAILEAIHQSGAMNAPLEVM